MEKNDVEFFGSLLNAKPEEVEQYASEGKLGEKIKSLNLMNSGEVETLKANLTKQVKEDHINELAEEAKGGNIDKTLYGIIKGSVIEKTERNLAKEHGIDSYDGLNDLVSKAISKNKGHTDDTKIQELTTKITSLQEINQNLVTEKDTAVGEAKKEYETKILTRDKKDMINRIPFDFSDVDQDDLDKITGQRKQIVESVFDARYNLIFKDDKVVAQDKEGNVVINPATLEPVPVLDVMQKIPVELGIKIKSPESGGQGGSSSGGSGTAQFKSIEEFGAYCEQHKILPTSKEGVELWAKRGPKL